MSDIKVVIFYSQSLFAAGIESRLHGISGLEVIRVVATNGTEVEKIIGIVPDVVIVDVHDSGFAAEKTILQILKQNSRVKVVSLDLNSNEISIYQRQGRLVLSGAELVAAITN